MLTYTQAGFIIRVICNETLAIMYVCPTLTNIPHFPVTFTTLLNRLYYLKAPQTESFNNAAERPEPTRHEREIPMSNGGRDGRLGTARLCVCVCVSGFVTEVHPACSTCWHLSLLIINTLNPPEDASLSLTRSVLLGAPILCCAHAVDGSASLVFLPF